MASYSIGEVEELTGVKAHVLRYWEEVIPGFAPKKDLGGRRVYTQRELDIINRLKYLIEVKKFTIEDARSQIIEESDLPETSTDIGKSIHDLREDLTEMYLLIKKYRTPQSDVPNNNPQEIQ